MAEDTVKVYTALVDFEHEAVTYKKDEKYELADSVVAKFAEGSVVEFVVEPPKDDTPPAGGATGAAEPDKETTEAKPWAGNHTVGRD